MATVKNDTRILVLHEGTLMEDGTHYELLCYNGTYQRFWQQQFEPNGVLNH